MKQRNRWPSDPRERALAERIVAARSLKDLRPAYREPHELELCDPMTGFCSTLSSALFHATGGQRGPYALFRIGRADLGDEDTHYFLVDKRKLPRWRQLGVTEAFKLLSDPKSVVVDLTASQFDAPIPYHLGRRVSLSQREGGDAEPTRKVAALLERAGIY